MTQSAHGEKPKLHGEKLKLNRPSQAFRVSPSSGAHSTSPTILIDARLDRTINRYVILWQDIQRAFNNVQCIRQDNTIVPFMIGSDFKELSPPRILYCRAVVFDVALKNTANGSIRKRQDPILCGTNVQQGPLKADSNDKANNNDMVNSMDKDNSMDKSHLAPDVKDDLQSTLRSCNQLFRSFCDTMMSDNLTQAKATMETMRRDLTTIQTTLTKTQPPQELGFGEVHATQQDMARIGSTYGLENTPLNDAAAMEPFVRDPSAQPPLGPQRCRYFPEITKTVYQTPKGRLEHNVPTAEISLWMPGCPGSEFLEWHPVPSNTTLREGIPTSERSTTMAFVEMLEARTWPELEGLTLDMNHFRLLDEDAASLLAAMPRLTVLSLYGVEYGPLSFQHLKAHFSALKEIYSLHHSQLTEAMLLEIAFSCPCTIGG
ncbi:hypothetical protein BC939DRAFT_475638 [Gamsiella multidivaricata]|uniref:uncharacterized protein n=1 Tax=Gamsiella multidivaricata TaxID=101098 RepID=UPI002220273C|nr:uncharacterized protein BC939DRAFT_475638 [Gamsiella multidivaricata]KAI7826960.1 hypothetical protein BC939DRAFT_475638 [Gamsiella multidivaricata]